MSSGRINRCHHPTIIVTVFVSIIIVQILPLWFLRPVVNWKPQLDLKVVIRPGINTTLIQPWSLKKQDGKLFLLVVVFSSMKNSERRQTIRQTWASPAALMAEPIPLPTNNMKSFSKDNQRNIKVIFLLGTKPAAASSTLTTSDIEIESQHHGDIIQEDFVDSYDNLTLKAVTMLKWIHNMIDVQPEFVMKTDDDTFVNVPRLVESLVALDINGRQQLTMIGSVICHGRVVRNIYDKFYVPTSVVPQTFYPDYLSGSGYVMTSRLAFKLYEVAFRTPFLFLEDVYVTGLCVRNVVQNDDQPVRIINDAGFSSSWKQIPMDPCVFHYAVTAHHLTAADMELMWTRMIDYRLKCGFDHLELRNSQRSRCGENWIADYVNSFT